MYGRCVVFTFDEVLEVINEIELGNAFNYEPDWPARKVQAFPNSAASLIVPQFDTAIGVDALQSGSLSAREMGWGFEESWKLGVVFNTRIESATKPAWRDSMEHRRCIILVASFFETHKDETVTSPRTGKPIKRKYEFRVPGEDVILIGCTWKGDHFSMVTTEANPDMAPIHHRMPLVVRQEELPLWLGPDYRELANRSSIKLEVKPA